MASRLELHERLCEVLGNRRVYFQRPKSGDLEYPAIVYTRTDYDTKFADNVIYNDKVGYEVTLMDRNPDSETVDKLVRMRYSKFLRHFATEGINHDVFLIYY